MKYTLSMSAALASVWILLSGRFGVLLLVLGAASVTFVLYLGHRMVVIDHESHPIHLGLDWIKYWLWLVWQIVKSNLDVARCILTPGQTISPTLVTVPIRQKTDVGRVTHANSITLTPGTVSLQVGDNTIEVHAISREAARDVASGEMDARVPDVGESR